MVVVFFISTTSLVERLCIASVSTVIKEVVEQMVAFDAEQLYMLAKCPRDTWIRNWHRNETLIDLTKIPVEIQNKILKEYDSVKTSDRSKLFGYFVEKKLSKLIQSIGDF